MKKLYDINEILFVMIIALIDPFFNLGGKTLLRIIGISRLTPVIMTLFRVMFWYLWISRVGMKEKYGLLGLGKNNNSVNKYLYVIPLVLFITIQLKGGIQINYSIQDMILIFTIDMGDAFIEEIIYRGFLFKALCKYDDGAWAIPFSSLIFGVMHLLNLIGGNNVIEVIMQVFYSAAMGLLYSVIFFVSKSIWPSTIIHGTFNACVMFAKPRNIYLMEYCLECEMLVIASVFLGVYFLIRANWDNIE